MNQEQISTLHEKSFLLVICFKRTPNQHSAEACSVIMTAEKHSKQIWYVLIGNSLKLSVDSIQLTFYQCLYTIRSRTTAALNWVCDCKLSNNLFLIIQELQTNVTLGNSMAVLRNVLSLSSIFCIFSQLTFDKLTMGCIYNPH